MNVMAEIEANSLVRYQIVIPTLWHCDMASSDKAISLGDTLNSSNNAPLKYSRYLILGEVVYIAIIYHISDS